jgi:hypothetical protein
LALAEEVLVLALAEVRAVLAGVMAVLALVEV